MNLEKVFCSKLAVFFSFSNILKTILNFIKTIVIFFKRYLMWNDDYSNLLGHDVSVKAIQQKAYTRYPKKLPGFHISD